MSMQDKDMDGLFRSKLDSMEVEPSARVWKGIVVELDGVKQKRTLIPILRIAATITVILGVGLFFLLKGGQDAEDRVTKNTLRKKHVITSQSKTDGEDQTVDSQIKQSSTGQQLTAEVIRRVDGHIRQKDHINIQTVKHPEVLAAVKHPTKTDKPQPEETIQQPSTITQPYTLAATTNNDNKIAQPVVPDESLNAVKPAPEDLEEFRTTNRPVLAQLPANKVKAPAKKHGIRSFGDLINVVVAKVDKRQDKVIEFSDTDGDESTITGVNLGIMKVKKDK